jgi:FtsP/CotA-like multicopper oxidase with cupredoxin domain
MKHGYMKNTWMTLLAILVTAAVGAPAFALTPFSLTAAASTMTLPDGKVVPVWGFANGAGPVTVPGPQLKVPFGETQVQITLTNNLPVPVSLVIPGFPLATPNTNPPPGTDGLHYDAAVPPNTPIPQNPNFPGANDGTILPKNRVLSLTGAVAAANGGTATYTFNVTGRAGTYIYESGTHQAVQIPMGLYGALVIAPAITPAQAYPVTPACPTCTTTNQTAAQVTYDQDQVVLFSEIQGRYDWTLNPQRFVTLNEDVVSAVATLPAGQSLTMKKTLADGTIVTMVDYQPLYYLINGKSYPDTIAPTPISTALNAPTLPGLYAPIGKKTLLRLINAGRENRVPTIQGTYFDSLTPPINPHAIYPTVIAEDGKLYNYGNQEFAPILPAGKSMDVMLDLTPAAAPGYYAIYDRRLSINNAGVFPGGMLTFLASWNPAGTDPRLKNCSPFKGDLNGDGQIDVVDALIALKTLVAGGYNAQGDVTPLLNGLPCGGVDTLGNPKTALTLQDAIFILQKAVGMNPY